MKGVEVSGVNEIMSGPLGAVSPDENETTPGSGADAPVVSDVADGLGADRTAERVEIDGSEAEMQHANDASSGPGAYIDLQTQVLGVLSAQWTDTAQMRKASAQRELPSTITEAWVLAETRTSEALKRALRQHPLWPWLGQFRGLGGAHTARLMARIRDPRRFPGQSCENGHIMAPLYSVGDACPVTSTSGEACGGIMLLPRTGTGVRPLWHYCGLHVVDGRSPRRQCGVRATWDVVARTSLLQPDGIADAIIKNRTPVYRDIYDAAKERIARERGAAAGNAGALESGPGALLGNEDLGGADLTAERDSDTGPAVTTHVSGLALGGAEFAHVNEATGGPVVPSGERDPHNGGAEPTVESAVRNGLRPIEIHERARKIAVKAFVGDLLTAWKGLA